MSQPDTNGALSEDGLREALAGARRVAFFGGSFDPPHLGHLAVARAAREAFRLDLVLFAPVGAQPLKPEGSTASFADRLAMTKLAIEGEPGFEVSLADAPKSSDTGAGAPNYRPNYTIDTLHRLRATLPSDCALYCLMGADSFFGLRHWHRAAELPFAASFIVAGRPGQSLDELAVDLPHGLSLVPTPDGGFNKSAVEVRAFDVVNVARVRAPFYLMPGLHVEISASEIRNSIRGAERGAKETISALPEAVAEYIRVHGLYR